MAKDCAGLLVVFAFGVPAQTILTVWGTFRSRRMNCSASASYLAAGRMGGRSRASIGVARRIGRLCNRLRVDIAQRFQFAAFRARPRAA
jgi:hypothetical protein